MYKVIVSGSTPQLFFCISIHGKCYILAYKATLQLISLQSQLTAVIPLFAKQSQLTAVIPLQSQLTAVIPLQSQLTAARR